VASLAKRTASGAAWTIITNLGSRALSLVGTLILARFIDPTDYGEVLGASVLAATALALSNLGLGQYLVAKPNHTREEAWHVTFYCVGVCALSLGVIVLLGPIIGPRFQLHDIMRYLPALACLTLLDRAGTIAERQLYKQLRFKLIGINNAVAEVLYAGVSLALVMLDYGGWAIVWGNVARTAFRGLVIFSTVDRRDWLSPGPIKWAVTREVFSFGLPLTLSSIAQFASRKWDNMLTSRFFGPALMGSYNLAYNLADVPAAQVGEQVGDVLLPVFAQLKPEERKRGLVRSVRLLAILMFPLAVGLGAVSETLVRVFFDSRWTNVAPMLTILSALSLSRPIGYAVSNYLQAAGKPTTSSMLEIAKLGLLLGCMLVLGRIGPMWVCAAVGIAFTTHAIACLYVISLDGIPFWATLGGLMTPLLACIPMVLAVLGVRYGLIHVGLPYPLLSLILEIVAGAVAFVASALVVARPIALDLIGLVKGLIQRRRKSE
jgi:lipopolysaccharide exporter